MAKKQNPSVKALQDSASIGARIAWARVHNPSAVRSLMREEAQAELRKRHGVEATDPRRTRPEKSEE